MVAGISDYGVTIQNQARLRDMQLRLNMLQSQVATGKRSDIFGGLGVDASKSLSMRAQMNRLESYKSAISTVKPTTDAVDQNMSSIVGLARDVLKNLQANTPSDTGKMDVIAQQANLAIKEIMQRLNSKVGGRYIFSGDQVDQKPIPDLSTILTNANTIVDAYKTGTAGSAVITSLNGMTAADLGYNSAVVSAGSVSVRADENLDVDYTAKADMGPIREILRQLATVASLEYDSTHAADFEAIYGNARNALDTAARALDNEIGKFGTTRSFLENISKQHDDTLTATEKNLSDVEDVDSAQVISELQSMQYQMQATYKTISQMRDMSLVNFI